MALNILQYNKRFYTSKQYTDHINEIEEAKLIKNTKSQRQNYILDTFEVYEVAGLKKIIDKRKKSRR